MTSTGLANGRAVFMGAFARACRPRKRLTVSQWADAHRVLTGKSAQESGRWRTERTPYAREPMDALSLHSPVKKVVVMAAIQMLKTELGLNWLGYIIDHAPGPTLSVQPTLELRDRYVLQRVNPMLESCETIAGKFRVKSKRDASNSRDLKDFPGGMAVFGGANSAASLSSMPIKNAIADEVDKFVYDLGGEGDPLGLIEGRQSNFSRSKLLVISSPTMKEASLIETEYEGGDMRQYHIPCPHCAELLVLKWKQLNWSVFDGVVKEAWYVCEHCGAEIEEHEKHAMLEAGRWIAQKKAAPYRSYHMHALYSPLGMGRSWTELVYQWLSAQSSPVKLKRFINTRLAETWEDLRHKMKWHELAERAEDYPLKTVPPGFFKLTAGIDTQNDRIAVIVLGHGPNKTTCVIDYVELPGDPNNIVDEFTAHKGALYDYLAAPFVNAWGKGMFIAAAGWDTGGQRTDAVYTMVRSRAVSRLVAMKGASTPGKSILATRPSAQDVNRRGKVIKRGVKLWLIGTDTAKDLIFGHLVADAEKPPAERKVHFSKGLEEDFYKMLLAEKYDPEKNRWIKKSGARNEALDCFVYALAAARHPELRIHIMGARAWADLKRHFEPADVKPVEKDDGNNGGGDGGGDNPPPERKHGLPRRKRRRRGGGFVGKF